MAKVLFINPIIREKDVPRHIPYGIALLATLAIQKGHLVQVCDANAWRITDDVLIQVLTADDWDVIAFGGISTTYGYSKKIAQLAKQHAPQALQVMGGGGLTAIPRPIMALITQVDIGVIGEAFFTFNEILAQVDAKKMEPEKIKGVIYRTPEGGLDMTPARPLLEDLDSLPYPAYELFPLEEVYFPNSMVLFSEEGMLSKRRVDMNSSFGCSLVCKFCFHLGLAGDMKYYKNDKNETDVVFDVPNSFTRTIRYNSPRYVVNMAKYLRDRFQVDFVSFLDENLMTLDVYSNRKWLTEVCELWISEGLQPSCIRDGVEHDEKCKGVHWSGTSHATLCNPDILKLMRKAGCSHLVYGYESFSRHILKTLGKGSTPDTNVRSYFWTMEAGIRPIPNQIIGFPSENFDSIRDDMKAWENLGIIVKPFFATPYPGSLWYEVYKDKILSQYDNNIEKFLLDLGDATDITAIISENFNAVDLYGLREMMIRFDYRRIAEYELEWKKRNPEKDAVKMAAATEQRWLKSAPQLPRRGSQQQVVNA